MKQRCFLIVSWVSFEAGFARPLGSSFSGFSVLVEVPDRCLSDTAVLGHLAVTIMLQLPL